MALPRISLDRGAECGLGGFFVTKANGGLSNLPIHDACDLRLQLPV